MENKVTFGNGLSGVLHSPPRWNGGGIILCHGLHSTKDSNTELAAALAGAGFRALRFDFAGYGESKGKVEELTITRMLQNIEDATAFLQTQANRLAAYGSSLGGLVALLHATRDRRIKALFLRAPAVDMREGSFKKLSTEDIAIWRRDGAMIYPKTSGVKLGFSFYEDALRFDGYRAAAALTIPVLVYHGEKDETVPFSQAKRLVNTLKEGKLVSVPSAKHQLTASEKERMISEAANWFERVLR